MDYRADKRLICSFEDRDFWLANGCEGRTSVDCGVVYRGVAVDGGDAEEVGGWVVGSEEDGEDVLDRVRVGSVYTHIFRLTHGVIRGFQLDRQLAHVLSNNGWQLSTLTVPPLSAIQALSALRNHAMSTLIQTF